jgi:DNA-binding response OmpR family regulator
LEGRNFEVTTADGVETALSAAKSVQFDLFIVDSWLRDGSGIDLCTKLREFRPGIPVLFYSGAAFEKDKRAALACGARGYLIKPVDPEILVAEVERVTANARSANDVAF